MNTHEINRSLKNIKGFLGTFPIDRLPVSRANRFCFVFNTDMSRKPGRHWIAVYVTPTRVEYFDATGKQPIILAYLRKLDKPVFYNNHRIQAPQSIACGVYCCDFIKRRSKGETFCEILSSFSRNSLFNDFLLV